MALAEVAVEVSSGGHFDKVIAAINKMTEVLRVEEQDDIKHRDRCQRSQNKNGYEMEDLNGDIDKSNKAMDRMKNQVETFKGKIAALEEDMKQSNKEMDDLLEMRNGEHKEFQKELKDDSE